MEDCACVPSGGHTTEVPWGCAGRVGGESPSSLLSARQLVYARAPWPGCACVPAALPAAPALPDPGGRAARMKSGRRCASLGWWAFRKGRPARANGHAEMHSPGGERKTSLCWAAGLGGLARSGRALGGIPGSGRDSPGGDSRKETFLEAPVDAAAQRGPAALSGSGHVITVSRGRRRPPPVGSGGGGRRGRDPAWSAALGLVNPVVVVHRRVCWGGEETPTPDPTRLRGEVPTVGVGRCAIFQRGCLW